ncbi:hypothetical protein [Methylobacterium isbiliense]|uniref:Uncharacterized protein n=1 Tax=Methylobacterium isbiliense TaxID=315478 RepID=A0ABQ4SK89_9HYPH|nr:hypothetical protein [Methylobacterium isbiliense]MDN3627685.1 hypothetical protein [Methylobacterium isbiliense]GJE03617.1 hypothetical protein GMJLKIPL_5574 [Methylobacterium isbiliense]
MALPPLARSMLRQETRALLGRLARIKPFALQETMLPAAALLPRAQSAVERFLVAGRRELRALIEGYLAWIDGPAGRAATPEEAHRRFVLLRLRFNVVLTQFDLFADVITQRSEAETGVWLGGLDVLAGDALALPGVYEPPPIICYLDRDFGAAIRRARTRLPGGGDNPVAIVRMPRERMVGSGIASSLVHEVGHQAASLLDLVPSLRAALQQRQRGGQAERLAWGLWDRWISEIVADLWSVARVGVVSTMGLMAVVALPRPFVFRLNLDDPHPMPWLRVKLSAAMGEALYPHPQWRRLAALWESYYPRVGLPPQVAAVINAVEGAMPAFVALLADHCPPRLRGASLREALELGPRQPARLAALWRAWNAEPAGLYRARPALVLAVLGQARADGRLDHEDEAALIAKLLTFWTLRATVNTTALCAEAAVPPALAA